MHVQHRLVIFAETHDVGERSHDWFQFSESAAVRGRDPQPGGRRSGDLDWGVRQQQLIVSTVYACLNADRSIRHRLSLRPTRDVSHGILLETERMCPQIGPDPVAAGLFWGKAKNILPGRPRRFRMFVVIIRQAAIDDQEVNSLGMGLD